MCCGNFTREDNFSSIDGFHHALAERVLLGRSFSLFCSHFTKVMYLCGTGQNLVRSGSCKDSQNTPLFLTIYSVQIYVFVAIKYLKRVLSTQILIILLHLTGSWIALGPRKISTVIREVKFC